MSDTVKLGYAANSNISFRGEYDTMIEREDWDEMSDEEKSEIENEALWDLVDLWVIDAEGSDG